jgi:hypothetical protein
LKGRWGVRADIVHIENGNFEPNQVVEGPEILSLEE